MTQPPDNQPQPYPGQPYASGQPPYPAPPGAAPRKPFFKKPWFLVVAGIVVIGTIASAVNGGDKGTQTTSGASGASAGAANGETPAPEPAGPRIGEPAADGKFQFVVNGVDCTQTQLGNEYVGTQAQGQFCIVDVTTTNVGDSPQSFFGDNAALFNAEGQEFGADSEAAIYLEDSASLIEEINPGNTLQSKVVFDVPAGTTPTAIELHDSAFSGGVTVTLQ